MTDSLQLLPNGLPNVNRLITTHDGEGKSVLSKDVPEESRWDPVGGISTFFLAYTTRKFPVSLETPPSSTVSSDISDYIRDFESPPGLSISTGTVLRYVDFVPNTDSPMHRTVSLDYGIVLEGEIELSLDSGETRIMRRGDVCIQRATNHAWRNVTKDNGWARMLFILIASEKLKVGDRILGEELNDIKDVKQSD